MTREAAKPLPSPPLTEADQAQARREYAEGRRRIRALQQHYSVDGLARRFGVSRGEMFEILMADRWEVL